jgi:signal transduction histidine kinase
MNDNQSRSVIGCTINNRRSTDRPEEASAKRLAQMKHDIRAPIGTVMGIATILGMSDSLTPRQKDAVEILSATAKDLHEMVENLFDFVQAKEPAIPTENPRAGQMPYQITFQFPAAPPSRCTNGNDNLKQRKVITR